MASEACSALTVTSSKGAPAMSVFPESTARDFLALLMQLRVPVSAVQLSPQSSKAQSALPELKP